MYSNPIFSAVKDLYQTPQEGPVGFNKKEEIHSQQTTSSSPDFGAGWGREQRGGRGLKKRSFFFFF